MSRRRNSAITFSIDGDWSKTTRFLHRVLSLFRSGKLDAYGKRGVEALRNSTPRRTGTTAESWSYRIDYNSKMVSITWFNTNENHGVNIAAIIQYGHGTRNGGYVAGIDYINPAMKPVFDDITKNLWKEVTKD